MANKTLQTRIALKYDTYINWTDETKEGQGGNLVLLPGEVGICAIPGFTDDPNTGYDQATTNPTVLFKVGDGKTPFKTLKWASALAADVHGWAKSENVALTEREETVEGKAVKKQYLQFKTGSTVNYSVDLSSFATDAEVETIRSALDARIQAIEESISTGGAVAEDIKGIKDRLDTIEGTGSVTGTIEAGDNAIKAMIGGSYTDENTVHTAIVDAKKAGTDADARITSLLEESGDIGAAIKQVGLNTAAISALADEETGRVTAIEKAIGSKADVATADTVYGAIAAGDKAIADTIGSGFNSTNTVKKAIEEAKQVGTDADNRITELLEDTGAIGAVIKTVGDTNSGLVKDVAANAAAIEALTDATTGRVTIVEDKVDTLIGSVEGDDEKSVREIAAEETAKIVDGANDKYDTLKEIADFIMGDTTGAAGMANDISNLKDEFEEGGRVAELEAEFAEGGRVTQAEADIVDLDERVDVVEAIVDGYGATQEDPYKTVKAHVTAIGVIAQQGVNDAKNAQNDVDALATIVNGREASEGAEKVIGLVEEVATLKTTVGDANKGLVKEVAANAAAIEALAGDNGGRVTELETAFETLTGTSGRIAALETIVDSGEGKTIRDDVTALKALTGDANKGNEALYTKLNGVADLVENEETGLAATKVIADRADAAASANDERLDAIEADYIRIGTDDKMYGGKSGQDYIIFDCGSATNMI
jgi:hypothetical protein